MRQRTHERTKTISTCYLIALMTAPFFYLGGCDSAELKRPSPGPAEVRVATPLKLPIVEWDEYVGRMDAIDSVEVRARVSGYLQSIHFAEGKLVEQGDLLFVIDRRPFQAALDAANARLKEANARLVEAQSLQAQAEAEQRAAKARLELATKFFNKAKDLKTQGAIGQEEFDQRESDQVQTQANFEATSAKIEAAKAQIATATAAISTAESAVASAKLDLGYTQIRAPISGRISRELVTEGNLVSGGSALSTLLTTIVSLDPIHCYFDANEQAFLKYVRLAQSGTRESSREAKNPVYLALVDEEGYPHHGHMDFVDNRIDPNTGTMRGRAIFPNTDGVLTPGLFAKVRLPGSGRYEAILVPDASIGADQSDRFVYVVGDDGSVSRRVVKLGPIAKGLRVIRSGLDGSETIIVSGLQRIFPGVKVKPVDTVIEPDESGALPDDYTPVPKAEWLSKPPTPVPPDLDGSSTGNASPSPTSGECDR